MGFVFKAPIQIFNTYPSLGVKVVPDFLKFEHQKLSKDETRRKNRKTKNV